MNEQVLCVMLALLRKVVCGAGVSEEVKASITPEMLPQLYSVSKAHDMAHLIAQGLSELGLLGEDEASLRFQKQQMLAVYRYQKLNYELKQIGQTLEDAKIPFVPLKGSVLRPYYPEPWMRTSCDIDVLVHGEDLDRAVGFLEAKGYKRDSQSPHDISFYSESGMHLELHYATVEEGRAVRSNAVLSRIWQYARPVEQGSVHMELSWGMFYFYHIAHMAKHFENGGCGIRPFLDLWIIENCIPHDDGEREALLEEGGLLPYANASQRLSAVWFAGMEHDKITLQMQSYVLFSGIYGTLDNRVAARRNKKGGRIRYIVSRIFPPFIAMKRVYPILCKHPWLLPILYVLRWFRLLRKGQVVEKSRRELNVNKTMSQTKISETEELFTSLGL